MDDVFHVKQQSTCHDCPHVARGDTSMMPIYFCNHPDRRESDGNGPVVPQNTRRADPWKDNEWITTFLRIPLECTRDDVRKSEDAIPPLEQPVLAYGWQRK